MREPSGNWREPQGTYKTTTREENTIGKQVSLLNTTRYIKDIESVVTSNNAPAINTGKIFKMSGGNFYRQTQDGQKSYGCVSGCLIYKAYDRYNKAIYIVAQPLEEDWGMYEQSYRFMTLTYRLED